MIDKKQYLLILKYDVANEDKIAKKIKDLGKTKLKSKSITKNVVEISYEIEADENVDKILSSFEKEQVINASVISYQNDFGA